MARSLSAPSPGKLATFRYVAVDGRGRESRGTIKAPTEAEAQRLLSDRGIRPISLERVPSPLALEQLLPSLAPQVKPRDITILSRQLATLLQAGLTLLNALELLQSQAGSRRAMRRVLDGLRNDLHSGLSFSQAIARQPRVFSEIYTRSIAVGEGTGRLEMVLRQLADYQEKQGAAAKKLKGALTYPAIIFFFGIAVSVILTQVALPPLVNMFQSLKVDLPLPTRILIGVTHFMNAYRLPLLAGALVLVAALAWAMHQPAGKRFLDRVRLTAPFIGPPTHMGELARFCRTVSMLVAAGVPLQEIMTIMPQTASNGLVRTSLSRVRERLMLGEGLSGPMAAEGLFPPLLVQMVAVGEESNTLDFTLGVVADFYETTAEEKMTALVGFLQPAVTVGVSLLTGFIAISVIMPMYSITGAF